MQRGPCPHAAGLVLRLPGSWTWPRAGVGSTGAEGTLGRAAVVPRV